VIPDGYDSHQRDAARLLRRAVEELARCWPDEPVELRELAAALAAVELAKELERRAVAAARSTNGPSALGWPRSSPGRRTWAEIGSATGMTRQSAHERWARRLDEEAAHDK